MYTATLGMSHHLRKSVTRGAGQWRTNGANFHATDGADVTPGCINIAPCWFQQGREVRLFSYQLPTHLTTDSARVHLPRILGTGSCLRSRLP
jgi:hypothetical protein